MKNKTRLQDIKSYYEERYGPDDMGPSRRSAYTFQVFLDWLEAKPHSKLLDVACGAGGLLQCAGEKGGRWGIDLSEQALLSAKRRVPYASLSVGDMQRLPYAESYFDYVTNIGGLEHVTDMQQALCEMARVCRNNGKLCLVVPNANFFWYKLLHLAGTQQAIMEEHLLSLSEWQSLIRSVGLHIIGIEMDPGPDIRMSFGLKVFLRGVLRHIALAITVFMPITSTYQFVFICEK